MKTDLYRHYDSNGNLLYVGISASALVRMLGHARSPWYHSVTKITISKYKTRPSAIKAEKLAIVNENPKHNLYRPKKHVVPELGNKNRLSVDEFVAMLGDAVNGSSATAVAKKFKISKGYLSEVLSGKRGIGDKLLKATCYRMDYVRLRK